MKWLPVNVAFAKPYENVKNFKNPLNVVPGTGTRNAAFRNAVRAALVAGVPYGANSVFGKVLQIGKGFVIKKMRFPDAQYDYLKIFLNELRVGSSPGIQRVGPKVYAWRVHRKPSGRITSAEYIMDDFTDVPSSQQVMQLATYLSLRMKTKSQCAAKNPIFSLIRRAMTSFWGITGGYHGDLHTNNMAVVMDKATGTPLKVVIFDYGAHRPFRTTLSATACFEDYIQHITSEFKQSLREMKLHKTTKIIKTGRNQRFRSNANMLEWMNSPTSSSLAARRRSTTGLATKKRRLHVNPTPSSPLRVKRRLRVNSVTHVSALRVTTSPRSKRVSATRQKSSTHVSETPPPRPVRKWVRWYKSTSHVSETR